MVSAALRDGHDTPIERAVELMLFLTSRKAGALSGRFVDVDDDLGVLLQQAAVIERDDPYTLQLRASLGEQLTATRHVTSHAVPQLG